MPPRTQNSPCSSTGSSGEKPATREPLAQIVRRNLHARREREAGRRETRRRRTAAAAARAPTRRRGAPVPAASPCSAPRARRRDLEMRRQAAVRIDFLRRKRQHRALERRRRQALEHAEKEPRVGRHLLDDRVGGRDGDHAAGLSGQIKGGRRRTEAGQTAGRPGEPGSRGGRLQQGTESERRRRTDQPTTIIPVDRVIRLSPLERALPVED